MPTSPPLHPDLIALAPLVGTWSGSGRGEYPTIESFGYAETIEFGHVGKPFLAYAQHTSAADDGRPHHAERGYWRVPSPGRIELVLAHPTGVVEVYEGTLSENEDGFDLDLETTTIGLTASAKEVTAMRRRFRLRGDELAYDVDMAAVGQPLQHHLAATLRRQ